MSAEDGNRVRDADHPGPTAAPGTRAGWDSGTRLLNTRRESGSASRHVRLRHRWHHCRMIAPNDPAKASSHPDSLLSRGSSGSILSIGSTGSILSIGSAGSILSIGSAGSFLSIGSAFSFGSVLSVASALSGGSVLSYRGKFAVAGVAAAIRIAHPQLRQLLVQLRLQRRH